MSRQTAMNLRAQVIHSILAVQEGQSLVQIQPRIFLQMAPQDRALWQELTLGVLRQWYALKQITLPLLQHEPSEKTVETALYVGVYQLLCTRIAQHAVVSETVEAVKQCGFASAGGLVNAVLRRVIREKDHLQQQLQQAHGLPSWLYKRLKKDWRDQLTDLTLQLKQAAPITLRVNRRQLSRADYFAQLQAKHIQAQPCQWTQDGIVLQQGVNIPDLPGYQQGRFSVQDEHAQLCATILPDINDKVVIDCCAAPGGKTTHILEKFTPKQLIALDHDAKRLLRVEQNLQRLQLTEFPVQLLAADAQHWQAPQAADCIIVDAPCTATGVLRRHPDIRLLRQSADVEQTIILQRNILDNMWRQLKTGGYLLYITCSILKDENERQMQDFFARHNDVQEIILDVDWGIAQLHGRQLFPQTQGGDGFYYCLLQKIG